LNERGSEGEIERRDKVMGRERMREEGR